MQYQGDALAKASYWNCPNKTCTTWYQMEYYVLTWIRKSYIFNMQLSDGLAPRVVGPTSMVAPDQPTTTRICRYSLHFLLRPCQHSSPFWRCTICPCFPGVFQGTPFSICEYIQRFLYKKIWKGTLLSWKDKFFRFVMIKVQKIIYFVTLNKFIHFEGNILTYKYMQL